MQGMILRSTTSTASWPPDTIVSNDPPYVIAYVNTSPQVVTTSVLDDHVLIQVPVMTDAESIVTTGGLVAVTEEYVVEVVDPQTATGESTVSTEVQGVTTSVTDADIVIQVPVMADAESAITTTGLLGISETNLVTIT